MVAWPQFQTSLAGLLNFQALLRVSMNPFSTFKCLFQGFEVNDAHFICSM